MQNSNIKFKIFFLAILFFGLFGPAKISLASESICPGGSNPSPNVLYCENFDDPSLNMSTKYYDYNTVGSSYVPVSGQGRNGTTALNTHWTNGMVDAGHFFINFGRTPSGFSPIKFNSTEDFREIYWRFYTRTGPTWTSANPFKMTRAMIWALSDWSQAAVAHLWGDGTGYSLMLDPVSGINGSNQLATSGWNDTSHFAWLTSAHGNDNIWTTANANVWKGVEVHWKLNTPGASDGIFEYWVDDILMARVTGLNFVGTWSNYGINSIMFDPSWNTGASGTRDQYLDDIVISRARIYSLINGQDTTPPAAPQGLTVQ